MTHPPRSARQLIGESIIAHTEEFVPERIYAVSDIHGHLDALDRALDHVSLASDPGASLVLLGDYVDRGTESCGVLRRIKELQSLFPEKVIALKGNHDEWLLDWLDGDDDDTSWLLADAGLVNVRSFLPTEVIDSVPTRASGAEINATFKRALLALHGPLIDWLRSLPLVHENDAQIFVHAGIDELAGAFWCAATPDHWLTNKYPATTGPFVKTVIAGHVRTAELYEDGSHGVFHDSASHYYIDGSVEITGHLNVLRYDVASRQYQFFDQI